MLTPNEILMQRMANASTGASKNTRNKSGLPEHAPRTEDCPASAICAAVSNTQNGCKKGAVTRPSMETCMVSLIQLTARIPGVFPEGVPQSNK